MSCALAWAVDLEKSSTGSGISTRRFKVFKVFEVLFKMIEVVFEMIKVVFEVFEVVFEVLVVLVMVNLIVTLLIYDSWQSQRQRE